MPISKSVTLLAAGIGLGWLLHAIGHLNYVVTEEKSVLSSRPPTLTFPAADPRPLEGIHTSAETGSSNHAGSSAQRGPVSEISRSDGAVTDCISDAPSTYGCREQLARLTRNADPASKIRTLEAWLANHPDDLLTGLDLVDILVKDRQYFRAIAQLESLNRYQVDNEDTQQIAQYVKGLIRLTTPLFQTNGRTEALASLYSLLVETEPQIPKWRYELARVLVQMEKTDAALDLLSYILYDAEFGPRASNMYQKIKRELALNGSTRIPVIKHGSQFLVEAVINGVTPAVLLVDTGASITSIERGVLAKAGVSFIGKSKELLQTVNGTVESTLVQLSSLRVGGISLSNVETASIGSLGGQFDGLLGMDILSRYEFSIDQDNRVLLLASKR